MTSFGAVPLFPNDTYSNPLTNTAAAKYVVPGATQGHLTGVLAANYDTVKRVVTLYLVADGGSAANSNILMQFDVLPGTPASWRGDKLLDEKYSIFAKIDSGSSVNLFLDGYEDASVT